MRDFTEAERKTIDELLARNLENATSEEIVLYGEWMASNAERQALQSAEAKALKETVQEQYNLNMGLQQTAFATLETQYADAMRRLEAVNSGLES